MAARAGERRRGCGVIGAGLRARRAMVTRSGERRRRCGVIGGKFEGGARWLQGQGSVAWVVG